jgi:glutamate carboxypeptidase
MNPLRNRFIPVFTTILLLIPFSATAEPAALDAIEQAIAERVERNLEPALSDLGALLEISSATEEHAGNREAGAFFAPRFEALGFSTRWIDVPEQVNRAGHFEAEISGSRGRRLLLLGHLDTVLPTVPVKREGDRFYGSGAADMKGGDILILYALSALHETGVLDDASIIVHFSGDEESVGSPKSLARSDMRAAAERSDVVLSFEGSKDNTAVVARRSSGSWDIVVESPSGHSSGIFNSERGSGAIFEAARILTAFHTELKGEPYLTFNASQIAGGLEAEYAKGAARSTGKGNIIPARAVIHGDIRVLSMQQLESVKDKMRAIVSHDNLPHTTATIEFHDSYPPMSPTDENLALLKILSQVSEDLGYGEMVAFDPGKRGAGDISFVAPILPGLDGLGVSGKLVHAAGEYMEIEHFERQVKRTALLIYRLTR